MHITRVQQWVGAILVLAVAYGGIAVPMAYVSTLMTDRADLYGRGVGIWVMSMVVGILSIEGALLLLEHGRAWPVLGFGVLPAAAAGAGLPPVAEWSAPALLRVAPAL